MKNKIFTVIITFLLFALCSCVSSKITEVEPLSEDEALLVGRLQLEVRNYYVNGFHKENINVDVIDMDSHKKFTLVTDKDGLFMMNAVPGHKYRIYGYFYTEGTGEDSAWIKDNLFYDCNKEIKSGCVNVVCDLFSEMDGEDCFVKDNTGNYAEVMNVFRMNYKGSRWLEYQMN